MHCLKKLYQSFSNQTTLKLIRNCKKYCTIVSEDEINSKSPNPRIVTEYDNSTKLLKKHLAKKNINWEKLRQEFLNANFKPERVNSIVFMSCSQLLAFDKGLSFYRHLVKNNEKLEITELTIVLQILSCCTDIYSQVDIVKDVYLRVRPYIENYGILQKPALKVFTKFKFLWKDLMGLNLKDSGLLVARAFDFDEKDLAFKMFSKEYDYLDPAILRSFFQYCIRRARENTFQVSDLDFLFTYCQKNYIRFPKMDLLFLLEDLIEALNSKESKDYLWSINETEIDSSGLCSSCHSHLIEETLNENEFETLKTAVVNDIFFGNDILYKSSREELDLFMNFLKTCSHYNFVIDGTNLYYSVKRKESFLSQLLDSLNTDNKKILLIARKHLRKNKILALFQSETQVFWTDNKSDDDVFVLYAALFGGCNTYFMSKDLFRSYQSFFFKNPQIRKLFIKWKNTHHYNYFGVKTVPPLRYQLIPQKTVNEASGIQIWHFPLISEVKHNFTVIETPKWFCLERNPVSLKSNSLRKNSNEDELKLSLGKKLIKSKSEINDGELKNNSDSKEYIKKILNDSRIS